jgi:arylformamidase
MTELGAQMDWRDMDATQRNAAYSPSHALPDGDLMPYLQAYATDSAAVYAAHDCQTISYGDKPSNTVDLFRPTSDTPAPLHIFIHGGYWQALSKRDSTFPASGLLSQGSAFAAVDYTLAPHASLDEIVSECITAVTLLFEQASSLGIDPSRITLSGSSAGAHLVAMTCLGLPPQYHPKAAVLLSGVYDLEPLIGTIIAEPLQMTLADAHANSPGFKELSPFPSTLLAFGEIEPVEFKRQSRAFANRLPTAQCLEIKSRNHFDIVYDLSNDSDLAKRITELSNA